MGKKKQPIVVILGMHRSGTSLVANFLNAVGIDFGQDLLPATEANEAGYWESREIWENHQKILTELNCDWHNPPPSFPDNWWLTPEILQFRNRLLEFVRSECQRSLKIWGFKDPRTAILLPMWQEIFDELQLEPLYILSLRNPGSVAASLSRRDRLAGSHSQALWLKTYLDVLSYAGNNLRAIVDYDRWFEPGWKQARILTDSLKPALNVDETLLAEAVNEVIHPALRHHSVNKNENEICWPIIARFYSMLLQATKDGKLPHEISEIATTFEQSRELLSIWNDMVMERDAIIVERNAAIAERNAIIEQRDIKIEADRTRLRKQRQFYTYVIIAIVAVFSIIISLLLFYRH